MKKRWYQLDGNLMVLIADRRKSRGIRRPPSFIVLGSRPDDGGPSPILCSGEFGEDDKPRILQGVWTRSLRLAIATSYLYYVNNSEPAQPETVH